MAHHVPYYGGDWHWGWSNYGSTSAGNGIWPYQGAFTVAKYDGDGNDDILGNGDWITMFHYYGGDRHWGWSNYGSTSAGNGIWPYRNRLAPATTTATAALACSARTPGTRCSRMSQTTTPTGAGATTVIR